MKADLDAYQQPFKDVVLQHMAALPAEEWDSLRQRACVDRHHIYRGAKVDPDATPAQLVDAALAEEAISVDAVLVPIFKERAVEIGQVAGQPVHYVDGHGIYVWGLEPKNGYSLSVWVSHPSYPPKW